MNRIKGAFKFFVAITLVLGSFKSTMAMEEDRKKEKEYNVISKELWQQIRKDDALRESVLREKVEELIEQRRNEVPSSLSVDGAESFRCEIGYPDLEGNAIVSALKDVVIESIMVVRFWPILYIRETFSFLNFCF